MESNSIIHILRNLETVCLVLAGIFLVVSVILFFVLDIKKVISDITGRTAKKEIANRRAQNIHSGSKAYKSSPVNQSRGKLTSKISESGRIQERHGMNLSLATEKIEQSATDNSTTVLSGELKNNETTVLGGNETIVLSNASEETTVLTNEQPSNETTVLTPNAMVASDVSLLQEIVFVHTKEIIV